MVIRNGGAETRITASIAGRREARVLAVWETRDLVAPVLPGAGLLPISVAPKSGFVPAEIDPGSTDRRLMGCRIAVELESGRFALAGIHEGSQRRSPAPSSSAAC